MKVNSLSSGERKGKSPNPSNSGGGCKKITSGVFVIDANALEGEYLDEVWLVETPWKGVPKTVTVR
jgi:hypothetical protein